MNTRELLGNPVSVKIVDIVQENSRDWTLYFKNNQPSLEVTPGQFLMVWVPSVDEIPMGICHFNKETMGFTVRRVGEATKVLSTLDVDDWIGIRGPFGTGYDLHGDSVLVVGGGIGMAPLRLLTNQLLRGRREVDLIIGGREASELLLYEFGSASKRNLEIHICTDDGSRGIKGLATEVATRLITEQQFDSIYSCGPEMMMHEMFQLSRKKGIKFQASLERYMKCGCGICGTCSMDPNGALVCQDGPVFSGEELEKIEEFGKYHRDEMGIKRKF
ncbi:dihydroorotate dehydrogenase electron transfer subunit [Candidatus Thorarchaeota archaeon]|nr:MAG: dihydroorotate dehydrogenase electron transfer subunit [Candidatus Thorarchaeota archaeon]